MAIGQTTLYSGVIDRTTSSSSHNDTFRTSSQMLVFNQSTSTIEIEEYYSPPTTEGYWHGSLIHLPIGPPGEPGFLISLMSVHNATRRDYVDPDYNEGNGEIGIPVTLDSIRLYDPCE